LSRRKHPAIGPRQRAAADSDADGAVVWRRSPGKAQGPV